LKLAKHSLLRTNTSRERLKRRSVGLSKKLKNLKPIRINLKRSLIMPLTNSRTMKKKLGWRKRRLMRLRRKWRKRSEKKRN
jgi:hypothetical protein